MSENVILTIRPSQVLNLPHFIVWSCIGIVLFAIDGYFYSVPLWLLAVAIISWRWLVVFCTKYELTTERIRFYRGVFNRKVDETELYRVRDYSIRKPFYLLPFGLGTLRVDTQDIRQATFLISGIKNTEHVLSLLRRQVEHVRKIKDVRDIDIGSYGIS